MKLAVISKCEIVFGFINPLVTNGFSHPYQMDESTFILGAPGVIFHFHFIFR